jgi:hypothetical protein
LIFLSFNLWFLFFCFNFNLSFNFYFCIYVYMLKSSIWLRLYIIVFNIFRKKCMFHSFEFLNVNHLPLIKFLHMHTYKFEDENQAMYCPLDIHKWLSKASNKGTKHLIFINLGVKKFIEKKIRFFLNEIKITLMFEHFCFLNSMKWRTIAF